MEQKGWTQTDLARELGVSQAWVSEMSRGQKDTGMAKAVNLLARRLGNTYIAQSGGVRGT